MGAPDLRSEAPLRAPGARPAADRQLAAAPATRRAGGLRPPLIRPWPALVVVLALGSAAPAAPAGGDPPLRGSLAPDPLTWLFARSTFLAATAGPAAALTLPAAIGERPTPRSLIGLDIVGDRIAGNVVVWQPGRLALGYRHADAWALGHNEDHYFAVLAQRGRTRAWAMELAWIKNDVAGAANALSIGTSALYRLSGSLSLASRIRHLNRPHFLDGRLARTIGIGVAYRVGRKLTLASDFLFRDDDDDGFAVRYGFQAEPARGLHLAAALDDEGGLRLAVSLVDGENQLGYGYGTVERGTRSQLVHLGFEQRRSRRPR